MYLPAEVCVVVPGQPSKAKLDGGQTQTMIQYAVRKPWENAKSILNEGVSTVGLDEDTNVLLVSSHPRCDILSLTIPSALLVLPSHRV